MATVQQLDPIYVDVNQSSSEWLQLQAGDRARAASQARAGTAPAKIVLEDGTYLWHTRASCSSPT